MREVQQEMNIYIECVFEKAFHQLWEARQLSLVSANLLSL